MIKPTFLAASLLANFIGLTLTAHSANPTKVGDDLIEPFARANHGAPLRYVVLGGSITQGGGSWIDAWLKKQFPKSNVTTVNSGMSATGSELGVFRIERDVIAHQPDLVALEFCVNDSSLSDEEAIRSMESLVVRLKQLPHPPAILMVEAASRDGVNLKRHRLVAQHYGLLEIDLQQAVDQYLKKESKPWLTLFKDPVHPNDTGYELYTKEIETALEPYVTRAKEVSKLTATTKTPLPRPLSTKPLLLDGRMVRLASTQGWTTESSLPFWWDFFFLGVLSSESPRSGLTIPVRGTTFGLFYALNEHYGSFYASVDGAMPRHLFTNMRDGYLYDILGKDLPAQEHLISIALPPPLEQHPLVNGPVKLGYALIAGESKAERTVANQGSFSLEVLQQMSLTGIDSKNWLWQGPYPPPKTDAVDGLSLMEMAFPPETTKPDSTWKKLSGPPNNWVDLRKITNSDKPGVVYFSTQIESASDDEVYLALAADYYAKLWLNGQLLATLGGAHGSAISPQFYPAKLRRGQNEILVKVGSGSQGFGFSVSIVKFPKKEGSQEISR